MIISYEPVVPRWIIQKARRTPVNGRVPSPSGCSLARCEANVCSPLVSGGGWGAVTPERWVQPPGPRSQPPFVSAIVPPGWHQANVGGRPEQAGRQVAHDPQQTAETQRPGPLLDGDGTVEHVLYLRALHPKYTGAAAHI